MESRGNRRTRGKLAGVLCLGTLLVAGCSGGNNVKPTPGDPLLGNLGPTPKTGAGAVVTRENEGSLAEVPAPSGPTSPAALASGDVPHLDDASGLRIAGGGTARPAKTTGITIGKPQPLADGAAPLAGGSAVQPVGGVSSGLTSIDQAIRALELRGATNVRIEQPPNTNQWRCTCSVPNRQNPSRRQTYDARAADALSALLAVLDRIENDTH
jgi:hypothetical protein